jgi:hypothetical protein
VFIEELSFFFLKKNRCYILSYIYIFGSFSKVHSSFFIRQIKHWSVENRYIEERKTGRYHKMVGRKDKRMRKKKKENRAISRNGGSCDRKTHYFF